MNNLVVRPMTSDEFESFRSRLVREYAAEHVRAGNWTENEAEARAAEQTDELLPQGAETPGTLLLMAETADGEAIGHVWVGLEGRRGSPEAWIYSIEIAAGPARQGLWSCPAGGRRARDGEARREGDRPQRLRAEHRRPQSL